MTQNSDCGFPDDYIKHEKFHGNLIKNYQRVHTGIKQFKPENGDYIAAQIEKEVASGWDPTTPPSRFLLLKIALYHLIKAPVNKPFKSFGPGLKLYCHSFHCDSNSLASYSLCKTERGARFNLVRNHVLGSQKNVYKHCAELTPECVYDVDSPSKRTVNVIKEYLPDTPLGKIPLVVELALGDMTCHCVNNGAIIYSSFYR